MIVIRIFNGIKKHFASRYVEWGLSVALINIGLLMLGPSNIFDFYSSYAGLAAIFDENTWGALCFMGGIMRLMALAVNGSFPEIKITKYTPHVRGLLSAAACYFWAQLVLSILVVNPIPISFFVYILILAFEIWCCGQSVADINRAKSGYLK